MWLRGRRGGRGGERQEKKGGVQLNTRKEVSFIKRGADSLLENLARGDRGEPKEGDGRRRWLRE